MDEISHMNSVGIGKRTATPATPGKYRMSKLDMAGVALSFACLIHCTILPVALALLPFLSSQLHLSHSFHMWLTVFVVPVAGLALFSGWHKHHSSLVLKLGIISMTVLVGAAFLPESMENLEHYLICPAGSVMLITAHILNHVYLHRLHSGCGCPKGH